METSNLLFNLNAKLMELLSNRYSSNVSWCMCSARGTQDSSQLQQDTAEVKSDDAEEKH